MYYQNQNNRMRRKQKVSYLQKLTMQLAVVLVLILLLILVKYVNNSTFTGLNEGVKKVFYRDFTDRATEVFSSGAPNAKNILENLTGSREKEMKIDFLPVTGKVISNFGMGESAETKKNEMHSGIDIEAKEGTEVKSVFEGTVEEIKINDAIMGQTIIINHNNGFRTLYGHLSEISVDEGQKIKTGDIIGKTGKTGKTATPLLHFELFKNYESINPLDLVKTSSN